MTIRTLFFSVLRDAVGDPERSVTLPDGATGYDLFHALATEHVGLAPYQSVVRLAVNRRFVSFETKLADGDEAVFIPPVSGG